jgi:REP element-mobilizing transposase RayT
LVFVAKHRRGVLSGMLRYSQDMMRNACAKFGAEQRDFNADHVHLAASRGGAPHGIITQYIEQQRRPG